MLRRGHTKWLLQPEATEIIAARNGVEHEAWEFYLLPKSKTRELVQSELISCSEKIKLCFKDENGERHIKRRILEPVDLTSSSS